MPDESCRNCGGELKKCTICVECRGTVSLICNVCGKRTTEQIHSICFNSEQKSNYSYFPRISYNLGIIA